MRHIPVRLPADVLAATDKAANAMGLSLTAYVRMAVEQMNHVMQAFGQAERMAQASRKCRVESLRVNAEFSAIESGF